MDPTKSFDHLDPKLKDTYARVMGTDTSGSNTAPPANPAPADPSLSGLPAPTSTPGVLDSLQTPPAQDQFATPPLDQNLNPSPQTAGGPNPGTEPTINSIPADTTTPFTAPAQPSPSPDTNVPATSTFFSNPSPETTEPSQSQPVQAEANDLNAPTAAKPPAGEQAPVIPYSPADFTNQFASTEQLSQPLPSPATVGQAAQHEASPLLRVIYIILAVAFFAAYTVFWIKIFNLPFLF